MLLQRVLTALALAVPALLAIFELSPAGLAPVLVAIAGIAAHEWAGLAQLRKGALRWAYCALIVGIAAVVSAVYLHVPLLGSLLPPSIELTRPLLLLASLWWLIALVGIMRLAHADSLPHWSGGARLLLGVLVIPATIVGLLVVRAGPWGPAGLLNLFAIVWAADIGAYFAGRAFGKHKLAPAVSPGKTWEGFAGGMVASVLVGLGSALWLKPAPQPLVLWLALTVVVATISVIGDLTESLLKRIAGVKDSGALLPGHGGVLDRIDSLLAAAPLMALACDWFS